MVSTGSTIGGPRGHWGVGAWCETRSLRAPVTEGHERTSRGLSSSTTDGEDGGGHPGTGTWKSLEMGRRRQTEKPETTLGILKPMKGSVAAFRGEITPYHYHYPTRPPQ